MDKRQNGQKVEWTKGRMTKGRMDKRQNRGRNLTEGSIKVEIKYIYKIKLSQINIESKIEYFFNFTMLQIT